MKLVKTLEFDHPDLANSLFGPQNQHIAIIANYTGINLETRGTSLTLRASSEQELNQVAAFIAELYSLTKEGHQFSPHDISNACTALMRQPSVNLNQIIKSNTKMFYGLHKNVAARTLNQHIYLTALQQNEIIFAIGPAGTGKTYLAVAAAVSELAAKKIKRIILTRPAVEAGEKLGYLPGDLSEKVNPYLRPLYDALHDMLNFAKVNEMITSGIIEVAPLAFMRGRTLNNSFIILDEAQNTTPEQMKMFLTRLGASSRAVITGDITQIDLPITDGKTGQNRSGLIQASNVLKGIDGIKFINFTEQDVVRHPLVAKIVTAYENYEKR